MPVALFANRYWLLFPLIVFLGLMVATIIDNRPIAFLLDDAYITLANAEILLRGGSDSFGNSLPTGATSPLHLFLLALLGKLMEIRLASFILSLGGAALYGFGLWKLLSDTTKTPFLAASGTVFGLVYAMSWGMLLSGLETGMAMSAVIWALWCSQNRHDCALAIIAATLPFIRPELAALSLFLLVSAIGRLRHRPVILIRLALIGGAVAGLLALASHHYTGHLLSPTAEAKKAFFGGPISDLGTRFQKVLTIVVQSPLWLPLIGVAALPRLRDGWAYALFPPTFLLVMAIELPNGLYHNHFRYLYPLLPLGLAGWGLIFHRLPKLWPLALASLGFLIAFPNDGWRIYHEARLFNLRQQEVALWVEDNLPPEAHILIHDAGYMPWHFRYVSAPARRFQLVDVVGLKSPQVIATHQAISYPSSGAARGEAISQIATEAQAQYAIVLDRPFWRQIEAGLRENGWQSRKLYSNPTGYQVYALTPPEADQDDIICTLEPEQKTVQKTGQNTLQPDTSPCSTG